MRPYPHRGETTPPSLRGSRRPALRDRPARPARHLPRGHRRHVARDALVLFPALATEVFDRPELSGRSIRRDRRGARATALSGWTSHVHHHGRVIVVAATAYGACIALAGLAPSFAVALGCFALAGAADMVSAVFRGTVWNQTIPEHMRGRLAGIEMLSYSVGPLGGQVRAGFVADAWSVRGSIVSGGLACVGGAPSPPRCCGTSGPTTAAPTSTRSPSGERRAPRPLVRARRFAGGAPTAGLLRSWQRRSQGRSAPARAGSCGTDAPQAAAGRREPLRAGGQLAAAGRVGPPQPRRPQWRQSRPRPSYEREEHRVPERRPPRPHRAGGPGRRGGRRRPAVRPGRPARHQGAGPRRRRCRRVGGGHVRQRDDHVPPRAGADRDHGADHDGPQRAAEPGAVQHRDRAGSADLPVGRAAQRQPDAADRPHRHLRAG